MKDFWEDLGKRLGETAETMTSMAGDAIEIQKLKGQVRTLARGNAVDLMALGRMIYDRFKAGEEVEESAAALCEAIRSREESMEGYEKKIAKIKGATECEKCGRMVAKDMAYCPYCGEKVRDDVFADDMDDIDDIFADEEEEAEEQAEEAVSEGEEAESEEEQAE